MDQSFAERAAWRALEGEMWMGDWVGSEGKEGVEGEAGMVG
jgi:hypothetical protein